VLTSGFTVASSASADPAGRTSSFSWVRLEGAESCIGTQELARAVEARLARKVFVSAAEADVSVEGHVSPSAAPARWRAVITIRDARGELLGTREIDSAEAECSALDEPLAFVVSVLIDPDAESRETPRSPEPETAPEPKPAPPPRVVLQKQRVLVPVPAAAPPAPWRVEAGAGVVAGVGLLPEAAAGLGAAVVIEPPIPVGFLLTGTYFFEQTVSAERTAESEVGLAHAGLALCPLGWRSGDLVYRLCAGALFGALSSRGVGFDTERSHQKLVVHAMLPNRVSVRIAGPVLVTGGITPLVSLAKSELTYRAADGSSRPIYEQSPVAATADLGIALGFP
jgi:hypothetical protein